MRTLLMRDRAVAIGSRLSASLKDSAAGPLGTYSADASAANLRSVIAARTDLHARLTM